MAFKKMNVADKLANAGKQVDMTKGVEATAELPAAGLTRLRFIGYVETGVQPPKNPTFKDSDTAYCLFELSGPKHPAKKDSKGNAFPHRMTIKIALNRQGLNKKSMAFKLFQAMNYDGEASHIAELLGQDFLGTVYHEKGEGADAKTFASLTKDGVPSVRSPFVEDAETGEVRRVAVAEPMSECKFFLWDAPDEEQWASIFIEGSYEDGKTKNRFQEEIKKAKNFEGSPVEEFLSTLEGDGKKASPVKAKTTKPAPKAKPAEEPADDQDDGTDPLAGL